MTVIGVFARADHPEGYGFCQGLDMSNYGRHLGAKAHGYVVVVVNCEDWAELGLVRDVLSEHRYNRSGERPVELPGFDPWDRGDRWYAGPYELVWSADVADVFEARPMNWFQTMPLSLGDRPSYGDNRAMAYLSAEEVLRNPGTF